MVWSAVFSHDGYASTIEEFDSKAAAQQWCDGQDGGWTVVKGTQMWNEPVGQTEEGY